MNLKVRILTGIASPTWSYAPGDIADVDEKEAARWIKAGIAEPVEEKKSKKVETATAEPPENTMKKPPKRRKAGK